MKVVILGASGSIGKQTIDVILKNRNDFEIVGFSVGEKINCIDKILKKFPNIKFICVKRKNDYEKLIKKFQTINFYFGNEGLIELIKNSKPEMVVNALVGFVGLKPSIVTLENNLILALANKESLVVGGELINNLLKLGKGKLLPIDSEHVALAKCLCIDNHNVSKLILTASGGAFRNYSRDELIDKKAIDALKHPTWKMGKKITIDCATMVNKTFEIIEAHYLFNFPSNMIDIILHDESYVHSLVEYKNGLYRLDYSKPSMENPIKWALYLGNINYDTYLVNNISAFKNCHFKEFSLTRYPVVKWADFIIKKKGIYGAIFNAANEVCVNAYLDDKISFLDIEKFIEKSMKKFHNIKHPTYDDLCYVDLSTRAYVNKLIMKGGE